MNRTALRHVVSLAVFSLALVLALAPTGMAFPRTVVDGLGTPIELEAPPQKIFSTGLAMDNLLLSVVDPKRVVGVTRFATDPDSGSYVTELVGSHMMLIDALSPEYIIAADPDLVLVAVWNDPDAVEQIRRLGYRVFTFANFNTVQDALDNLMAMGTLTGEEERAQALVADFDARYKALREKTSALPAPRVLYYSAWGSTVGLGTTVDDIIRYAGGVNVISELGIEGWPQIDAELILERNPEVIITDSGQAFVDQLKNDPLLATIDAVQSGRVYHIDHMNALDHHLILAIEQLAGLLFSEVSSGALQ